MTTSTFQRLYDSEINFEVSCFYDADFDVRLGDALNGFLAQDKVPTWEAVEKWLHYAALKYYPNSAYARHALGSGRRTIRSCLSVSGSPNASGSPEMARMTRIGEAERPPCSGIG
jgi:hypothetical protein